MSCTDLNCREGCCNMLGYCPDPNSDNVNERDCWTYYDLGSSSYEEAQNIIEIIFPIVFGVFFIAMVIFICIKRRNDPQQQDVAQQKYSGEQFQGDPNPIPINEGPGPIINGNNQAYGNQAQGSPISANPFVRNVNLNHNITQNNNQYNQPIIGAPDYFNQNLTSQNAYDYPQPYLQQVNQPTSGYQQASDYRNPYY